MKVLAWARWPILRGGIVTAFELVSLFAAYAALVPRRRRHI